MKRLAVIGVSSAIALAALVGSAPASAAIEFGDNCTGTNPAPAYTLTTLTAPSGSLPLTAPISGVVTQVKQQIGLEAPPTLVIPEEVKVLHPTGAKNTYTVTAQTIIEGHGGLNVVSTRVPIQAGDRLGLHGLPFSYEGAPISGLTLFCGGAGIEGVLGAVTGNVGQGATAEFLEVTTGRVPISATVEPDADGDGFGDETQDKCPTNASTQDPCPTPPPAPAASAPILLSATSAAGKGLVTLTVTSTAQASVSVGGNVSLGKGKTAKLSGGTQIVAPGALAKFTVLFPANLKAKLKQLTTKQSLPLKLAVSALGATTKNLTVKVKGQMKSAQRHKKH
jgi:hypothetical protein